MTSPQPCAAERAEQKFNAAGQRDSDHAGQQDAAGGARAPRPATVTRR
jgi:hypothetical protein